jgi:hypothetical protein
VIFISTPMAPTLVREPFHRDRWVYEEEVDSRRMLAYKDGERPHGQPGAACIKRATQVWRNGVSFKRIQRAVKDVLCGCFVSWH